MPIQRFEQGTGYSGTVDVTIRQSNPSSSPASGLGLFVDGNSGNLEQVLLAFTDLFGDGPGQIPIGATITSATLTIRITDASTTGVSVSRMLIDWPESSSWNSLGDGVQLNGIEAAATPDLTIGSTPIGFETFDVTASLQAWLQGATTAAEANDANDGWVFTGLGTDPFTFRSSESAGAPVLNVTYTMPDGTAPRVALTGPVSQSENTSSSPSSFVFTVNRSGDTTGSATVDWTVAGSGTVPASANDFAGGAFPSGTVTFDPGETSRTIVVAVNADSADEPDETFTVTLSNPGGGAEITEATATGTIVDDDSAAGGGGGTTFTTTFEQGANYTGTADVMIRESRPNSAPSSGLAMFVDGSSGAQQQSLLAFNDLFGTGPGQIPIGATITSATLTVRVTDGTTTGVSLSRMLSDWNENSSWNSLLGGVQLDGVEAASTSDFDAGAVPTGFQDFDVTASLQAWLNGASTAAEANDANNGWVFTGLGTDLFTFRSSESAGVPVLTVTYTTNGGSVPQIALSGAVSHAEGSGTASTAFEFTVTRAGDTSGSVSVNYGVTGVGGSPANAGDFVGNVFPSGTITFDPGQTSRTITIIVASDVTVEQNETFRVTLSDASNGAQITGATATGTIVNDDQDGGGTGDVLRVIEHDGSSFGPGVGCTDPTDVAYDPSTGTFLICDSEVDETPFNSQNNLFRLQDDGDSVQAYSMRGFTSEPTGLTIWQDRLYITDDNRKMVWVVDKDNPTTLLPGLSFSTTGFGGNDPEDLSVNPANGNLFLLNEKNKTVYELQLTSNGPRVVDTIVMPDPLRTTSQGAEGLVYDAENDQFYVCAGFSSKIYIVSRDGELLGEIDDLTHFPNDNGHRVVPKGLELAPSSDGIHMSLWVTDYGVDQVADGRLFEIILDRPAQQSSTTAMTEFSFKSSEADWAADSTSADTFAIEATAVQHLKFDLHDHQEYTFHHLDALGDNLLF